MNSAMVKVLVARVLGVGSAATTTFLWCTLLFFNPYDAEGITGGTYVVGALMIMLALLVAWGAWTLRSWVLVVAFVASFFSGWFLLSGRTQRLRARWRSKRAVPNRRHCADHRSLTWRSLCNAKVFGFYG